MASAHCSEVISVRSQDPFSYRSRELTPPGDQGHKSSSDPDLVYESPSASPESSLSLDSAGRDLMYDRATEEHDDPTTQGHSPQASTTAAIRSLSLRATDDNRTRSTPSSDGTRAKRRAADDLQRPAVRQRTPPSTFYGPLKGHSGVRSIGSKKTVPTTALHLKSAFQHNARNPGQQNANFIPKQFDTCRIDSGYESRKDILQSLSTVLPEVDQKYNQDLTKLTLKLEHAVSSPTKMFLQPETAQITQEQLAAEVKGIYAGLVLVEAKSISINTQQAAEPTTKLQPKQWQAMIALQRTLLYEHHDFLMATQHPSANTALRALAAKYCMPARMWKHGIHAFLEVLRHRRPDSQEYMLTFIYLAYDMIALLFETVPSFLDTWIECLGDLARYRMAIEEDKEIHATWGGVAARWYTMAADRHPQIGRLYHHLGILERPSLRKFYFYCRSLTSVVPFTNAKESLGTLCAPILQDDQAIRCGSHSAEAMTICYHARVFSAQPEEVIKRDGNSALELLPAQSPGKIAAYGLPLATTNISSLLEYGSADNVFWQILCQDLARQAQNARPSITNTTARSDAFKAINDSDALVKPTCPSDYVVEFFAQCFNTLIRRELDQATVRDLLQFVHVHLVWFSTLLDIRNHLTSELQINMVTKVLSVIKWDDLAVFLNELARIDPISNRVEEHATHGIFLLPERPAERKPLLDDYALRGIIWADKYTSAELFQNIEDDDGSRVLETPNRLHLRAERVEWLACRIAHPSKASPLTYDRVAKRFGHRPLTQVDVDPAYWDSYMKADVLNERMKTPQSLGSSGTLSGRSSSHDDYDMVSMPSDLRSASEATRQTTTKSLDNFAFSQSTGSPLQTTTKAEHGFQPHIFVKEEGNL